MPEQKESKRPVVLRRQAGREAAAVSSKLHGVMISKVLVQGFAVEALKRQWVEQ